MGNAPSNAQRPRDSHTPVRSSIDAPQRRESRRRESVQGLPTATATKATPAPPSTNLDTAVGQPIPTASPTSSRVSAASRNRSNTSPSTSLKPASMGQEASKPETIPVPPSSAIAISPVSKPIDAPVGSARRRESQLSPPGAPSQLDAYSLLNDFSRPPRLPLPIEEEVYTPGSPILSPLDPLDDPDDAPISELPIPLNTVSEGTDTDSSSVQRKNSVISSNADDEDEPEEFLPNAGSAARVPTLFEWRDGQPTDKIYVTGTFADWEKKFRLHWDGPSKHPNTLSTTLNLPPGTHHLKFLVNNDMITSPHLPTTVDYTNILVNYIEVAQPTVTSGAAPVSKPMEIRQKKAPGETASPARSSPVPARAAASTASPTAAGARSSPKPTRAGDPPRPPTLKPGPQKQYTSQIPQYLIDLDTWPPPTDSPDSSADESSIASRYRRAAAVASAQPEPPSLPLFLSKSILNSSTAAKDDSSVLVLPNHTVLNHLSTTSIRAGVLASSCTCRYKQRFLTTIFYRPRSDDSD